MVLRRVGRALALTVVYAVVILAGLELGTRFLSPQSIFSSTVNTWDERLGTRQVPGATGFVSCDEYYVELAINSKGLRDREFPYRKPNGVRRILSLGDSFACGYGVAVDRTYAKVLEGELTRDGLRWEVLNGGVGSTGTAHQLAYFVDEGRKYEPDIVLVGLFIGNDPWDNVLSGLYTLGDGALERHEAPLTAARRVQRIAKWIPGYDALLSRSHFLSFVKLEVARWHRRQLTDAAYAVRPERDTEWPTKLTERLLTEFERACADNGASFVVMVIPAPANSAQLREEQEARTVEFLRDEGIPCLNLGPRFREERARRRVEYARDSHWTETGHRLAALELRSFLEANAFLGAIGGEAPSPGSRSVARF